MKAILMPLDAVQHRAQFVHAALFGPRGVDRAQMHAEDPESFTRGHQFDERVARHERPMPRGVRQRFAAEEAERLLTARPEVAMPVSPARRFTVS
jgi:hypothetical protein